MKIPFHTPKIIGVGWVLLPLLVSHYRLFAADMESGASPSPTNLVGRGISSTNPPPETTGPGSLPLLKPRRQPAQVPPRVPSAGEQSRLQSPHSSVYRGQPGRTNALFRPGPARGVQGTNAKAMSPNYPAQSAPALFGTPPRHVPSAVLKKYDLDKNGILDAREWYEYRRGLEQRRAESDRINNATNSLPSPSTTNRLVNP